MIWGIDISDYQPDFDLARARREGYDFAIIKATEGTDWKGKWFRTHLDRARAAGMLVAAYHYVRSGDVAAQVRNIQSVVPRDCPLILDIEKGAGPLSIARDLHNRLAALGYRLPLTYLPKWYADQIGARDLRGLAPLWYSRYPNSRAGGAIEVWNRNASWLNTLWGGYYGQPVEILQFTDQGRVAGRGPVDLNAYRGSREQLAVLLGGGAPTGGGSAPGSIPSTSGEDVAQIYSYDPCPRGTDGKLATRAHTFVLPVGSVSQVTANAWLSFKCMNAPGGADYVRLQSIRGDDKAGLPGGQYPVTKEWKGVAADHTRVYIQAADGSDQFVAYVQSEKPYSLCIEVAAK